MDEVGGSGMESSRSCKPSDVVDGSKEPGDHGWMEWHPWLGIAALRQHAACKNVDKFCSLKEV